MFRFCKRRTARRTKKLAVLRELVQEENDSKDRAMCALGNAKRESIRLLKKVVRVLPGDVRPEASALDRSPVTPSVAQTVRKFRRTVVALKAMAITSSGVPVKVGAWALVSTYGTASTGTLIASLAGASRTSAILALLGGGAKAAGGGGMVAGRMVVFCLYLLPPLVILTILKMTPSKQLVKVRKEIAELGSQVKELRGFRTRIEDLTVSISQCNEHLNREYARSAKSCIRGLSFHASGAKSGGSLSVQCSCQKRLVWPTIWAELRRS
jgi:hypothetical protein